MSATPVFLVVGRRQKVHRVLRSENGDYTFEADNLDHAGSRTEVTSDEARALILANPLRRCRRCIPTVWGDTP